ncbi:peptidoglycan-binding protein [Mycolicibacterium komossense]|uniref:Peptidoglycan-binding protein n=1 Tax=Mycolicibacterium komossense TaxID=1779 RepID=A0ABT3CMD8_9MYCO|nr:peptidoglycan-binding protein [Mycolicibacterium komossense]MCV7230655.1 peptidoglycan-binding protein [Mycolicibacterium komossense]
MAWQQPQLTDPPMQSAEIGKLNRRLLLAYAKNSKAVEVGVTLHDVFDAATDKALRNIQDYLGIAAGKDRGVLTYETKLRLGVIVPAPTAPTKRFIQQGVGFSTDAFLIGNPNHSYIDAVAEGSAELLRLALPDPRPKIGDAYSMGGDVLRAALEQWPADRRDEWKLFTVFGNPSRRGGPTLLGNDPGGSGISGVTYPEWTWDRLYDFTHEGDMYPNATGLLPQFYQILVRMEASVDFALYLFQVLSSSFGPIMLGLVSSVVPGAGALAALLPLITGGNPTEVTDNGTPNLLAMITNIPAIIQALLTLLKFVQTNAHFRYHDQPETFWRGLTAVDCAAQIITEKVTTAVVYTVPGTVANWNDGPPAWTAWKLP